MPRDASSIKYCTKTAELTGMDGQYPVDDLIYDEESGTWRRWDAGAKKYVVTGGLVASSDGSKYQSPIPLVDTRDTLSALAGTETFNVVQADGTPKKVSTSQIKTTTPVPVVAGFDTKANMTAAAATYNNNDVVYVTNDPTTANNGTYRKSGAAGGGTWVQTNYDRIALVEASNSTLQNIKLDFQCGKNKFDSSDPGILVGKYLADNNGSVQTSANYTTTGYIHVLPGVTYTAVSKYSWVWYDGAKTLISISPSTDTNKAQTAPANAYFARICFYTPTTPVSAFMLEVSSTGVPSTYEPYHSSQEIFDRATALEGRASYKEVTLSLSDAGELVRAGATLQAGALGNNAAISLPHLHCLPAVIEFDMKFPADPNAAASTYELVSLNQKGNGTPWFKMELTPKAPTVGYYVPTFAMDCTVAGAASPTTQSFIAPLGPDAFSIRKVTPINTDTTIICETTVDRVKLYNGGTSIGEWLFTDYATVTALTAAMRTALGSAYVVTDYNVAGYVPSDLGVNIAYICKAIAEVDPNTGVATGQTIYDSFETFIPTKTSEWHRVRIEINPYAPNPTWVQINIYMDDLKIFNLNNGINLKTSEAYTLFLNYTTSGGNSALCPMRNFSLSHKLVPLPRFACVMTHTLFDSPELPATGSTLQMSSGRLRRVVSAAKKYGWTFGTLDDLIGMTLGLIPRRDKMMVFTCDDSLLGWDDQPEFKRILEQNNIKVATGIITGIFDFSGKASQLLRTRLVGNGICSHASIHLNLPLLSYSQLTTNMNNAISQLKNAGYDVNSIIYPGGATSLEISRWMINNGYSIGITVPTGALGGAGSVQNYGASRVKVARCLCDDYIPFSNIDTLLNIT